MKVNLERVEEKELEPIYTPKEIVDKRSRNEITPYQGLEMLQMYARNKFPQDRIVKLIDELCTAEDTRHSVTGLYKSPNWGARHKGIQEALKVLSINDQIDKPKVAPVNIQFNVLNGKPVSVKTNKKIGGNNEIVQHGPG